jgi:hypothetical protein
VPDGVELWVTTVRVEVVVVPFDRVTIAGLI